MKMLGELIKKAMKEECITQREMAVFLGLKGQQNVSMMLDGYMEERNAEKMLNILGYEIVLVKKGGVKDGLRICKGE